MIIVRFEILGREWWEEKLPATHFKLMASTICKKEPIFLPDRFDFEVHRGADSGWIFYRYDLAEFKELIGRYGWRKT